MKIDNCKLKILIISEGNIMSGHSKWSQIKRQKGVADKKKGQSFSKLSTQISLAARSGEPETNLRLRLILDQARKVNMPSASIQRAIDRGLGKIAGQKIEEFIYETYGPSGTAFLIEAATDNRNRTTSEIKSILSKNGGKLAESGSVKYLFEQSGEIVANTGDNNEDELMLAAIDAGAKDIQQDPEGKILIIQTAPGDLQKVKENLEKTGAIIEEAKLTFHPKSTVYIDNRNDASKILNLSNHLEEIDEVIGLSSNFDIKEDILESFL